MLPILASNVAALPLIERLKIAEKYLRAGYFRDGWAFYEARRELHDYPERSIPTDARPWSGAESLAGRSLLLWHEQGLGDMIQMLRFVPMLVHRGVRVVVAVQPGLQRLAASLPGVDRVVSTGDPFEDTDFHAPLLSLPHLLRIRLATLPAAVPYLRPPEDRVAFWRDRLGPQSRLRVGIVCSGNADNRQDPSRSIPAGLLAPLLDLPGVEFHLLQTEIRDADRRFLQAATNLRMHADALTDLAETAALAMHMDLVITVCTAMAHLAGAVARPGWVMLAADSYCLWLADRTDSPWYPTLRLFRQPAAGAWQPVIADVARALQQQLPAA